MALCGPCKRFWRAAKIYPLVYSEPVVAPSFDTIVSNVMRSGKNSSQQADLKWCPGQADRLQQAKAFGWSRHFGMATNCAALYAIADRPAQPHGDWQRFGRDGLPGIKKLLYRPSR